MGSKRAKTKRSKSRFGHVFWETFGSSDISGFSKTNQVILRALKKYGMFVADNGGDWFLSGAPNPKWNDTDLHNLKTQVKGTDFEAVNTGEIEFSF